ncbi:MAG: type IV pilus twitching motility protein PilT [Phycisphaerales bacterium]
MLQGPLSIDRLLAGMRKYGASDLHIRTGLPPFYRVNGSLSQVNVPPLTAEEADELIEPIIPEMMRADYDEHGGVDFAKWDDEGDRYRCAIFKAGGHANAAIRRVNPEIPSYAQLHLPPIYERLISKTYEGLILVVGVTGSGKSTTLAAMIDQINATRHVNIITIEDPVEYRFVPKQSIIAQREIGIDVDDFKLALRHVVRMDPDVILIGELRDRETVLAAIQASETGHLVFGTMHTADTMQSFNRILEFFDHSEHGFIRSALANTLKAVCAQRLLPAIEGFEVGRLPATEVLLTSPTVRQKIRDGEEDDIPAVINQSREDGMHSFTQSLASLVEREWVTKKAAMEYAPNQNALDSVLKGVEVKSQGLVNRIRSH